MTHSAPLSGPSREATAELVAQLALAGRDDPTIAARVGITVAQVRGLRGEYGIPPGARRAGGGRGETG